MTRPTLLLYPALLLANRAAALWRTRMGLKTLLVGVHQFLIHPLLLEQAWRELYGPPTWHHRLVFFLHDFGYITKQKLDDAEGERHVELGAVLASRLLDRNAPAKLWLNTTTGEVSTQPLSGATALGPWGEFSLLHSRYYCKQVGLPPSRLCVADKWVIARENPNFYLLRGLLSGEIWEYVEQFTSGKYNDLNPRLPDISAEEIQAQHLNVRTLNAILDWHHQTRNNMDAWVRAHAFSLDLTPDPQ